jgi:hypothetical protein
MARSPPASAGSAGFSDVARLEVHMQAALQNTSFPRLAGLGLGVCRREVWCVRGSRACVASAWLGAGGRCEDVVRGDPG